LSFSGASMLARHTFHILPIIKLQKTPIDFFCWCWVSTLIVQGDGLVAGDSLPNCRLCLPYFPPLHPSRFCSLCANRLPIRLFCHDRLPLPPHVRLFFRTSPASIYPIFSFQLRVFVARFLGDQFTPPPSRFFSPLISFTSGTSFFPFVFRFNLCAICFNFPIPVCYLYPGAFSVPAVPHFSVQYLYPCVAPPAGDDFPPHAPKFTIRTEPPFPRSKYGTLKGFPLAFTIPFV